LFGEIIKSRKRIGLRERKREGRKKVNRGKERERERGGGGSEGGGSVRCKQFQRRDKGDKNRPRR
jgi:hypothetical protein